jgi:hypothetical protein
MNHHSLLYFESDQLKHNPDRDEFTIAIGCVFEVGNRAESAFSADEPEERLCQKAREVAARRASAESAEEESVLALEWLFQIRADS